MPRPTTPVAARVARLLSVTEPELKQIVDTWPTSHPADYPCIHGPSGLKPGRSTQSLISAIFELILEEPLHPTWRPVRRCGIKTCRNPLHYDLRHIWRSDGTRPADLPLRCSRAAIELQLSGEADVDPEEVIDTVLSVDGGREMTPEQLSERFTKLYSVDEFAVALKTIRATGL